MADPTQNKLTAAQRRLLDDAIERGRVIAYGSDRKPIKALVDLGLLRLLRYDNELPEYAPTEAGRAA